MNDTERVDRDEPHGIERWLDLDRRLLADASGLAWLHRELARAHGAEGRRMALRQLGFVYGLVDATALRRGFTAESEGAVRSARPVVSMSLSAAGPSGFGGTWPDRHEAEAVLLVRGPGGTPGCHLSEGYTSGWMSGLAESDWLAFERRCAGCGAAHCGFELREASAWLYAGTPAEQAVAAAWPFVALRAHAERFELESDPQRLRGGFDRDSSAIHVWGPVMVVPYSGDETAVAVETVSRDPAAARVSVVVVDLQGAVVDDGFGAVALERVLEVVEARGAEAILAGVSPLSERVVSSLVRAPLWLRKDLDAAISTAFQIALSQRQHV